MSLLDGSDAARLKRSFFSLAFLLQGAFLSLLLVHDWNSHVRLFLGLYLVAFLIYGIAARQTLEGKFDAIPRISLFIFVFAISFRLIILFTPPTLSLDIFRYIWDGKTQAAGFGAYDYAPDAPQLQAFRGEIYKSLTYPNLRTLYPPAVEILFNLLARVSTHLLFFKFAILLFELLLIEVLRRLLKKEKLSPSLLILYAWHPLSVVEFSGSGHLDVIGMSLLMSAYLLLKNSKRAVAGSVLGFAALIKYVPVLALPWFVRRGGWKFVLLLTVTVLLLILPYYTPDLRMLESLTKYYQKWRFNDSLFGIFYHWLGGAEPARRLGIGCIAGSAIFCLAARYSFYRSFLIVYGTVLLFSPIVHPWYICWLIPVLVFHPNRPWLFLTGWIALSYFIRYLYPDGLWQDVLWLRLLIYVPFFFLLGVDLFRSVSNRRTGYHPLPNKFVHGLPPIKTD